MVSFLFLFSPLSSPHCLHYNSHRSLHLKHGAAPPFIAFSYYQSLLPKVVSLHTAIYVSIGHSCKEQFAGSYSWRQKKKMLRELEYI